MIATGEGPVADIASRILSGVTAMVSQRGREWGLAMQAELATIDGAATRLRFAGGCVRVLICDRRLVWTLAGRIALAAVAMTVLIFTTRASVGVAVEAAVVVVLLGGLSWRGRRNGRLGPVDESGIARRSRTIAYSLAALLLLTDLSPRSGGGSHDPSGWWLLGATIVLFLAVGLAATGAGFAQRDTLRAIAAVAVGSVAGWSATTMLLSTTLRAQAEWPLIIVAGSVLVTVALTHSVAAGMAAGSATSVLIFLAAAITFTAVPSTVPDIAGSSDAGGLTAAARAQTNRTEAMDPYIVELLLGAVFATALLGSAVARPSSRHRQNPQPLAVLNSHWFSPGA